MYVALLFTTLNAPAPVPNATGIDAQNGEPVTAISVQPSALKSPTTGRTFAVLAHAPKLPTELFMTVKLPLPLLSATGIEVHPDPPVSAMSVNPSRLKSPANGFAPA